jgi:hypothetical protein
LIKPDYIPKENLPGPKAFLSFKLELEPTKEVANN